MIHRLTAAVTFLSLGPFHLESLSLFRSACVWYLFGFQKQLQKWSPYETWADCYIWHFALLFPNIFNRMIHTLFGMLCTIFKPSSSHGEPNRNLSHTHIFCGVCMAHKKKTETESMCIIHIDQISRLLYWIQMKFGGRIKIMQFFIRII